MIDFPGDHSWVGFGVPMYQAIFCELLVVKETDQKKSPTVCYSGSEKIYCPINRNPSPCGIHLIHKKTPMEF